MQVNQKVPSQQQQVTRPMFFRPLSQSTPGQPAMDGDMRLATRITCSVSYLWKYNM
ncbi:MAG TPA: hypothetical protein VH540_11510 [Ktedonobacterales bacterium]